MFSPLNSLLLPEYMFMEILSWLPLKDVVQLRYVSKVWNHLVSILHSKLHLQLSPRNTHILFPYTRFTRQPIITLKTLHHTNRPFNRSYSVLGVCNGLVCLQDSCVEDGFEEYCVRIWNPVTRIMSKDSPHICLERSYYKNASWFMFGFGYDELSDTYHVLFLDNNNNESQKLEVRVWSLGDTCWRNTLTCDAFPIVIGRESRGTFGTFVSGTLNWLAFPKSYSGDVKTNQLEIFSYHIKNETYANIFLCLMAF